MARFLSLLFVPALACVLTSCSTVPTASSRSAAVGEPGARFQKVRTTAYTHSEGTGGRNALGRRLATGVIKSAASDWSRYPVGTRFRILSTGENHVIDDYGGALVGTNTIDLYKTSRREMNQWGVRLVDIEILEWGSPEASLRILKPRRNVRIVRRMIAGLEQQPRRL